MTTTITLSAHRQSRYAPAWPGTLTYSMPEAPPAITTREARQNLFYECRDNRPADALRRDLFDIADQNGPLPAQYLPRYLMILARARQEEINRAVKHSILPIVH